VQQTNTATSSAASDSEKLPPTADLPQRPRATPPPGVRLAGDPAVGAGTVAAGAGESSAGRRGTRLGASQAGDPMPARYHGGRDAAAKPRRAAENQKTHMHSRR